VEPPPSAKTRLALPSSDTPSTDLERPARSAKQQVELGALARLPVLEHQPDRAVVLGSPDPADLAVPSPQHELAGRDDLRDRPRYPVTGRDEHHRHPEAQQHAHDPEEPDRQPAEPAALALDLVEPLRQRAALGGIAHEAFTSSRK
jgi:hypothetical protein